MNFLRPATQDAELGSKQVKAGNKGVTGFISANYDEQTFPHPYDFAIRCIFYLTKVGRLYLISTACSNERVMN